MCGDINLLIKKAQEGDMPSFEKLIINYEKIVYNIAYKMLPNFEDVKDISQEVFIKVYKNLNKFNGKSSFSTWVYRITVNSCIDELRRRKGKETESIDEEFQNEKISIKKQFESNEPTPEESSLKKEKTRIILEALEKISPEHKTMLILRDIEGFSYEEISAITKTPVGTVKSRIARARQSLKNILLYDGELSYYHYRQKKKKGGGER